MILIVVVHVGGNFNLSTIHQAKVTTFFMLSGFFFSAQPDIRAFLKKKYNTILFPFLVFYIFSYLLFYLGKWLVPGFDGMTDAKGILDCFTQKQYFNGPLWFLLALFWLHVITYFILNKIKNPYVAYTISFLLSCLGFGLGKWKIELPLNLDTALATLFVFHLGYLLRKHAVLDRYNKVESGIFAFISYISCLLLPVMYTHSSNEYTGSIYAYVYISIVLSFSIIFFSKALLDHSGILAFIGRHSMWIMCAHHLVYRPIKMVLDKGLSELTSIYVTFVITMIICCLTAPYVERLLPRIVGKTK